MKKLSKAILIAVAAMLALGGVVIFGINLYVQSPGVQARIQEEISRVLRMPLQITNTSLTPWSDLRITGITIPNGGTNLLEAAAFNARYRLLPIFTGRLVIYNMSVENPKIVWPQNAAGEWKLPQPQEAAAQSAEAAPTPTARAPEPAAPAAAPKKKSGFQVIIEGFEIKHGNVELLDQAQRRVAVFSDVYMIYSTLTPERIEGIAEIGRIVWAETLALEKVRAPFNYSSHVFDLPQISATLGGGAFTGSFNLKSAEPKSPFTCAVKFEQVDLARIAHEAGWAEGQAAGMLGGAVDLHGSLPQSARAEGAARLTLTDGRFHEFSYFEMIGQALQIKQLSDLRLKQATADARIADEKLHFENVTLDAADLQLTAKGIARFDGKLQLTARLIAQNALIKQLPGLVRENFSAGENDARYIDFNITGKADKPKTDLLDKIVGQKLESQFDELVNGLFGSRKKKEEDKKEPDKPKDNEPKKSDKKKKKKESDESAKAGAGKAAAAKSARRSDAQ